MSFSRATPTLVRDSELDHALRSIGMRVGPGRAGRSELDLEVTLVSATVTAMPRDFRLLGVLVAWLEIHHAYVNVPRLKRLVTLHDEARATRAFWAAVGGWLGSSDSRWGALEKLHLGAPVALDDPAITALQIERVGVDPRFAGSALQVPANLLRSRSADVDPPEVLAARHQGYRMRVRLGPTYRADVWRALDRSPDASPAEVAREVGCAYETARAVAVDWKLDRRVSGHL